MGAQWRPGLHRMHPKSTCSLAFLLRGTEPHLKEPYEERGLPLPRGLPAGPLSERHCPRAFTREVPP